MDYKFKLDIGDWSDDGHCKSEVFIVASSVPIEEVREAYFKGCNSSSEELQPHNICSEFEESTITKTIYDKIVQSGYEWPTPESSPDDYNCCYLSADDLALYTLWFIEKHNPKIKLKILKQDEIPSFHFYGYENIGGRKRHIPSIGYGLFYA